MAANCEVETIIRSAIHREFEPENIHIIILAVQRVSKKEEMRRRSKQ
jgi:hypothetical protein